MRDELLEVTGGTVTGAGRLAPRLDNGQADNRLWEVMVQPGSEGRVTIALAPGRACGETGAVCTADGRALSEGVAVGILGPEAPLEFLTAVADGATLILTYDELLDESGTPPASAFTVTVGGAARAVDAVSVAGRAVTLTLAFAVTARDAVTVSYTVPEGPGFLRDTLGTIAASFGARAVTVNTVAAARLTARFEGVSSEHDGSSAFTLRLAFSETIAVVGYRTVRDELLEVTGGTATKAGRLAPRLANGLASNRLWEVTVQPDSDGTVTIALAHGRACGEIGAVCTADGRALSGPLSETVPGPAALAVADATVHEGPGAKLDFVVTLDRARHAPVSVRYASADGTATAGADYSAASGTLTFATGERAKTVEVTVLDDAHHEGSETLTLTLSSPSGARIDDATATGTIVNRDPLPKAWMVRFGRTVGSQVVEGLTGRLEGGSGSHVTVGGIELTGGAAVIEPEAPSGHILGLTGWTTEAERHAAQRTMTADELLLGSAFHLSSAGDGAGGPTFTAWGRVATGGFDTEVNDVSTDNGVTPGLEGAIDGDVTTGLIGFDAEWDRALAGLMLSQSTGERSYRLGQGDHQGGGAEGTVESTLTGVYPYASMDLNPRISAWAIAGLGSGELTLKPTGMDPMATDLSMRMGAVGVKGRVLDGGAHGLALNVRSDALWVSMENERTTKMVGTEGDVSRLRLILEGERAFEVNEGATFTPSAEVGVRHDGGDAETGTGLEVGVGVRYTAGALTVEGRVRALVAHEDSGYEEWGASGAIRIAPSQSGRGLALRLSPTWGRTGSGTGQLWSAADASGFDRGGNDFEAQSGLDAELGYGFGFTGARDVLTPYTGLALGDAGSRRIRLGTQWRLAPEATVTLEATREDRRDEAPADALMLRGSLRF